MRENRNKIIFMVLLLSTLCLSFGALQDMPKGNKIILTGIGFDNYRIGQTSIQSIIADFGNDFEKVHHNSYSAELIYKKLGLSFYYYPELSDTIFGIEFFYPFLGTTDKGITLNESTMADVELVHDSLDWYIVKPFLEWYSEYPGIEYGVPRDTLKPIFPLDAESYKKMKISKIVVLDNFDDFDEN